MSILAFAKMADDCYSAENPNFAFEGWVRSTDKRLSSVQNGNFFACAYEFKKANFVTIAFRGTVPSDARDVFGADFAGIGLSLNSLCPFLKVNDALDFTHQWSRRTRNIWLVGHSLGGAYVQIAGALLKQFGMTFNAPGVLHLVNQYSQHPFTKIVGGVCNPAMQVLSAGLGAELVNLFNKAVAAADGSDLAFAAVANYRAQYDPVSVLGSHVGAPINSLPVKMAANPHAMAHLVEYFQSRA